MSAHRTPDLLFDYASSVDRNGISVIIAGAGGAAHAGGAHYGGGPTGKVCAKMSIRAGYRCTCHYLIDCPKKQEASEKAKGQHRQTLAPVEAQHGAGLRGKVCAKMSVRAGFRCACHYLTNCPKKQRVSEKAEGQHRQTLAPVEAYYGEVDHCGLPVSCTWF